MSYCPQNETPFEKALRALDTLEEIDLTLMPIHPTPEMTFAASEATGMSQDVVNDIYRIMVEVSQLNR